MTNSADPDQLTSLEAKWSGSTLFAKAGYIQVQQDKGLEFNGPFNTLKVMSSWSIFFLGRLSLLSG